MTNLPSVEETTRYYRQCLFCRRFIVTFVWSEIVTPPRQWSGVLQLVCLSVCVSICVSVSISLELLDQFSRNFVCRSAMVVARSSSGGVAIRYVLPVLLMTSRLAVVGHMAMRGRLNL